jgi:flagellar motor switch protein FliM
MDKILSQDEINALFSAMASEDLSATPPAEKASEKRKVVNYDFHKADRISSDQMRSLHQLHDYFGRNFSSSLSAYLRSMVDVHLISVDQISYSEFLKILPDPTLFASVGLRPLDNNIAIELNPSLVLPMIDMLLGGLGHVPPGERSLTEIEMNIIEGVIRLAMQDLKEAWRPIMELDFFLEGSGTKPQMFQIVSAAETVVAVGLQIKVAENSGMMNICIPSRMLKVIRHKFDQQWNIRRQKIAGSEADRILNLLKPALVAVSSEIWNSKLSVDDLLKISAGDIIQLNQTAGTPVVLCVGGVPKFAGHVVNRRGRKAFEIVNKHIG